MSKRKINENECISLEEDITVDAVQTLAQPQLDVANVNDRSDNTDALQEEKKLKLSSFTDALLKKELTIKFLDQDISDSLYTSVSYAISMLPSPYNVHYTVQVLRHKTSEYMLGHSPKFIRKFKSQDMLKKYCNILSQTRMEGSPYPEVLALANALQVKIQIYYALKLSPDGFIFDEYGEVYSNVIRIAYLQYSKEFLPILATFDK